MRTWRDWPTLDDQRRAMEMVSLDRPTYDAHLRRPDRDVAGFGRDPVVEGYLSPGGSLIASGAADLPRVRISTELFAKGGYKRDITLEFPAIDPTSENGAAYIRDALGAVDAIAREHVALMERLDKEDGGGG